MQFPHEKLLHENRGKVKDLPVELGAAVKAWNAQRTLLSEDLDDEDYRELEKSLKSESNRLLLSIQRWVEGIEPVVVQQEGEPDRSPLVIALEQAIVSGIDEHELYALGLKLPHGSAWILKVEGYRLTKRRFSVNVNVEKVKS